jgi:hypothetical protein
MSVGAVNKQTGDRIPTAGMPAVDSVLSGVSTNPVQNRVVKAALDEKADTDMVAADFDATASYTAGNYCVQDGKLYKFKNNHSGAWASADVDEVKITGELSALKSGLINKAAANRGAFNGSGTAGGKTSINISDYGTNFPALILCTTWRSYSLYAIFKEPNNLYTFSLEAGGAAAPTLTASDATTILITNTDSAGGRYMLLV